MPTTVSGLTFFNEQFETGAYQGLTQFIDGFNANSGGAIVLIGGAEKGRVTSSTFFQRHQPIQRRDPSANADLTPTRFSNVEKQRTKLYYAAPTDWNTQDWIDQGLSDQEGTRLFGISYGEDLGQNMLNSALAALIGAIGEVDDDSSASAISAPGTEMTYGAINAAKGLLGDRRGALNTIVSHSVPLVQLDDQAFTSQQIAFRLGGTNFFPGGISLGLRVVNTDATILFTDVTTSGADTYNSLLLQPGAITIRTGETRQSLNEVVGTRALTPANQQWRMNVWTEVELEVMGVSYTAAGINPVDSDLATLGNWTAVTDGDVKNGPGVILTTQEDQ